MAWFIFWLEEKMLTHVGGAFLGLSAHTAGLFQNLVQKSSGLVINAYADIANITSRNVIPVLPVREEVSSLNMLPKLLFIGI